MNCELCVRDSSENPFRGIFMHPKRLKRIARPEGERLKQSNFNYAMQQLD
jgi:hypothetical protein